MNFFTSTRFFEYLIYIFAFSSAFSISAMTVIISIMLLIYLLRFKHNLSKFNYDFSYFAVFYMWRGITDIFNGLWRLSFSAFGDIWDKIPYITASQFEPDREKVEKFIKLVLWANIIILIFAILQKYAGFPVIVKKLFTEDWTRFKGYHSHPLRFAGYFSTVCVIALSFGIYYRRYYFYLALILISGLILNGSRTYWISFFTAAFIISFIKSFKTLIYTLLISSFIFGSFYVILPETSKRVEASFNPDYSSNRISNFELRKNFWKAGFETSLKSPLYGIGAKKVSEYLKPYQAKSLIDNTAHCHSIYITYLAESGIIGLGLLIFIIFYFIRKYFLALTNSEDDFTKAFSASLLACWLNMSAAGFFETNFSTFSLWAFMSVWMGLFEGYLRNKQKKNLI